MEQVPRESLLFVIRAFGGVVSWDGEGAPYDESDESITHQVMPNAQSHKILSSNQNVCSYLEVSATESYID